MWFKLSFTTLAVAAMSCCLIIATSPATADILHVPGDFLTIQEAIDAAMDGDEVEVHPGTYSEAINFLGKAITVRSSDGPEVTTIDGTGFFHVVKCVSGEGRSTVLDGFTITGGSTVGNGGGMYNDVSSPTVTNCTFSGNSAGVGGGMYNSESNPSVTNCTFSGNSASGVGGGMYNFANGPTVTNCTFSGNSAGVGGGMYNDYSSPTVTNCTFSGNMALDEFGRGGGMFIDLGSPVISDCTLSGNMAAFRGGGIYLRDGSMTVTNCTFEGNSTPVIGQHGGGAIFSRDSSVNLVDCDLHENEGYHGGAVAFAQFSGEDASLTLIGCSVTNNSGVAGGGVFNHNAAVLLINSTLTSNQVNGEFGIGGGILLVSNSSAVLTNTTIIANSASEGGGVWLGASSAFVRNGILWDNIPDQISGSALVRFSDVQGGWSGAGSNNIDSDPLFVDPDDGDYRLSAGSLCIDSAANIYLPKDIDTDLDGNPRFVDDPDTKDTGVGDPPIVDMGAYEFQAVRCPWDLDNNGSVGVGDLLILLANWANPYGVSDLLALLANWGPCP